MYNATADASTFGAGLERPVRKAQRRSCRRQGKHRVPGVSPHVSTFGNPTARRVLVGCDVANGLEQYVKQEVAEMGEHGREARATRLITERASTRIGKMACEIALQRPRKVRTLVRLSSIRHATFISLVIIILPLTHAPPFASRDLPCIFFVPERNPGDLAQTSSCFPIYPARHNYPQVERLVCDRRSVPGERAKRSIAA